MAEAPTPSTSTPMNHSAKKVKFVHSVPPPQDMDRSKLDWLLLINEEYFEEELKTVVSGVSNFYIYYTSWTINCDNDYPQHLLTTNYSHHPTSINSL